MDRMDMQYLGQEIGLAIREGISHAAEEQRELTHVRRERIATAVLAGLCAHPETRPVYGVNLAEAAVMIADALIAELDKNPEQAPRAGGIR
jgi:hypothetical protein